VSVAVAVAVAATATATAAAVYVLAVPVTVTVTVPAVSVVAVSVSVSAAAAAKAAVNFELVTMYAIVVAVFANPVILAPLQLIFHCRRRFLPAKKVQNIDKHRYTKYHTFIIFKYLVFLFIRILRFANFFLRCHKHTNTNTKQTQSENNICVGLQFTHKHK